MKFSWRRNRSVAAVQPPTPGRVLGEFTVSLPREGDQARSFTDFTTGWVNSIHLTTSNNQSFPAQLACSPGAWRAVTLLSALFGGLNWRTYLEDDDPMAPDRLVRTPEFIRKPDPFRSPFQTYSSWAMDYLLSGNAMAVVGPRDEYGMPTSLLPFYASAASVQYADPAAPLYVQAAGGRIYTIGSEQFTDQNVLHVMGPCAPGALRGMAVLEVLCEQRELWKNLDAQAALSASVSAVPPVVISDMAPDADADDVAALKAAWTDRTSAGAPAFTNGQIDVKVVGWSPKDNQLLEARQFSLTEVALAFGMPLHFVAATPEGGLTYSTTVLEADDLLKFGKPAEMIAAFEQAMSELLPPGMYVKADASSLLRLAPSERSNFYATALTSGWMTVNEVRAAEDLPPIAEKVADDLGDES